MNLVSTNNAWPLYLTNISRPLQGRIGEDGEIKYPFPPADVLLSPLPSKLWYGNMASEVTIVLPLAVPMKISRLLSITPLFNCCRPAFNLEPIKYQAY